MDEGDGVAWGRKDEGENAVLRYLSGSWHYCCLPACGVRASRRGAGVESAAWKRILGEP